MSYLNAKLADSQFIRLSDTQTCFNGRDALPVLVIDAPFCQATIALQGAQLLTFQPTGDQPWLWLSPLAQFEQGKSIRGGIPVCLPWFGVNRTNPEKPKHGFVRNHEWQLSAFHESDHSLQLEFHFSYDGENPGLFSTAFSARLILTLSNNLEVSLQFTNTADTSAEFSWALHSYLAVDDCRLTRVSGLEGLPYMDNTQHLKVLVQDGAVEFLQEVDRVYNNASAQAQIIHAQQSLSIRGDNCPTCIVWNAGKKVAATLADIREHYKGYICVERGCAFNDSLNLTPGESFNSRMMINKVEL
jgi:glucose-6-phosphate 1-epimerase